MNSFENPEPLAHDANPITRRSFMKKSALSAGAITMLGRGLGVADPISSLAPNMDSPWTEYEYVNNTPVTIVGTGATKEDAKVDFDTKCDSANVNNAGKSKVIEVAPKVDITNMVHVYKIESSQKKLITGALPPPIPSPTPVPPPGTGYRISVTFNDGDSFHNIPGTRFRVIKWE